ncbi:MAG: hypothetical protein COV66_11015 [Nitrospinae bacterium CG11_big_fil_rev_8_21_14_0_20_45_15]|nr:MAG: hypothetical protein COV66_11015 [Nitrospinae bacterium CG11_big_fil_rev_8_21_14_0_20_45_15]
MGIILLIVLCIYFLLAILIIRWQIKRKSDSKIIGEIIHIHNSRGWFLTLLGVGGNNEKCPSLNKIPEYKIAEAVFKKNPNNEAVILRMEVNVKRKSNRILNN